MRGGKRIKIRKSAPKSAPKERKSLYEKMSGRKNPAWADKVYNSREFPSLYERITGKRPQ